MSTTTYGWLVLLFPLLGTLTIALGYRVLPGRSAGWIGTGAILLSSLAALGALISLQGHDPAHRELTSTLWDYANTVGVNAQISILVDPLSVFMILIVSGISSTIHLYSISYMTEDKGFARYFAYLNFFVFAMLLLVLAGNFLLLIVGWALVGAASYLLISFWYRRTTATRAGIKAFVINVLGDAGLVLGTYFIFKHTHTLDFLASFKAAPARVPDERSGHRRRLPAAARGSDREVRADTASHVAPRRDGGTDSRQRADPRGDDGHRRRVSDRAHARLLRTRPRRPGHGRGDRRRDASDRGHDRAGADGHQARDRLLDDVADRLHDHGRSPSARTRPGCSI